MIPVYRGAFAEPVPRELLPMGVEPPIFATTAPSDEEDGEDFVRPRRGWSPHGVHWEVVQDEAATQEAAGLQCPACMLLFSTEAELAAHVDASH